MDKPEIYKEERPWGGFTQYTDNEVSTVKILRADPDKRLSLQYHNERRELWIPLDNNALVTVANKTWNPKKFDEIFIETKQVHRLSCGENGPAFVMEISFGLFDEKDIVRIEDDFHRGLGDQSLPNES